MTDKILNVINSIELPDEAIRIAAKERWDSLAKPVGSLGKGEDIIARLASIQKSVCVSTDKRCLVIFCADNGVVAEGVASSPMEITAFMTENFIKGDTAVAIMCKDAGVDIYPVDIGVAADVEGVINKKIAYGTKNMAKTPAMSRNEVCSAIETGIDIAFQKKSEGYNYLLTGEMGIGNTTTSAAVASVLLGRSVEEMTGRGAGLSDDGLERKISVIKKAIGLHKPDAGDVIDVLSKVGGFDIAGMTGLYLGAAACNMPVIMDGFISAVAALSASRLCENVVEYIIPSHISEEPAMRYILEELHLSPVLSAGFRLGEGTGAVALVPFIDMMRDVYLKLIKL